MKNPDDVFVIGAIACLVLGFSVLVAGVWLKAGGELAMVVAGLGLIAAGFKCADAIK